MNNHYLSASVIFLAPTKYSFGNRLPLTLYSVLKAKSNYMLYDCIFSICICIYNACYVLV